MSESSKRPGVLEVLGPIVARFPRPEQPAFVALAERLAAKRYRGWAEQVKAPEARRALLDCADREEEIAARVEARIDGVEAIQGRIAAEHPDLAARYGDLFGDASLAEQLAIQAEAERVGAATWRAFAEDDPVSERAEEFRACARLEEESAEVLEGLVAAGAATAS